MTKKILTALFAIIMLMNCGGGDKSDQKAAAQKVNPDGLTEAQIVNGIGPITALELGPMDQALVGKGKEVFDLKCVACHKVEERLVGPPMTGITSRRSPAFIMNMILNPDEMVKKHPEVKAMLATYYVPMTFQNVTEDEARAILEYLRTL